MFQRGFTEALASGDAKRLEGLIEGDEAARKAGLAVWRNNVFYGLSGALKEATPCCAEVLGEEGFLEAARGFVSAGGLPRHAWLTDYGEGFGEFLDDWEGGLSWLGDLARVELAWTGALLGEDSSALSREDLSRTREETRGDLCFRVRPSVRLARLGHDVLEAWEALRKGERYEEPAGSRDLWALASRCGGEVRVWRETAGTAKLLGSLGGGATLGEAYGEALEEEGGYDLPKALSRLMMREVFSACWLRDGGAAEGD